MREKNAKLLILWCTFNSWLNLWFIGCSENFWSWLLTVSYLSAPSSIINPYSTWYYTRRSKFELTDFAWSYHILGEHCYALYELLPFTDIYGHFCCKKLSLSLLTVYDCSYLMQEKCYAIISLSRQTHSALEYAFETTPHYECQFCSKKK